MEGKKGKAGYRKDVWSKLQLHANRESMFKLPLLLTAPLA